LGIATSRTEERALASVGCLAQATVQFERCDDVPNGGVICALPALLAVGLLHDVRQCFAWPKGYYPMETIFLSLAFLALAEVPCLEALRYEPPGEWGRILGMDRIPEVRTMREKVALLCRQPEPSAQWSNGLARYWMESTEHAGVYYVDAHARVYHGSVANRPKAYVAREQLCLRATLDYWVNAMDGQPFFVLTQELNQRLVQTLTDEIIPRLKAQAPHQPSSEELAANPDLHRFVIVFDREGYSPDLFRTLQQERIAIISYAKRCKPTENWPAEEFVPTSVTLINGQTVSLWMAERGVSLSNGHWVREVRHRDEQGYQTAILSTDRMRSMDKVAAALFARWCQENFFRYMIQHYSLDHLIQHGAEELPDTSVVVNPARRTLENRIRSQRTILTREQAALAAASFPAKASAEQVAAYENKQGELLQSIQNHQQQLAQLKAQRATVPRHVPMKDLPPDQRYTKLRSTSKHFIDTIKMIAYRAETALLGIVRPKMSRPDDARSWIRQVLQGSANLIPDPVHNTLTVQLHPLTNPIHNEVLKDFCSELTATETIYPNTDLRLIFTFLGPF